MELNNKKLFTVRQAGAAAATVTTYVQAGPTKFRYEGFSWMYETAEVNVDNTLDWVVDYTVDGGSNYVALTTNANAVGLLDTGAVLTSFQNKGDAVAGGGAAVAVTPTAVEVPANAVLRYRITTAGTGTVPPVSFTLYGVQH